MSTNPQTIIETILAKLGMEDAVVTQKEVLGKVVYHIETNTPGTLIGSRGATLRALTFLVKRIAEKQDLSPEFMIDVNEYRLKRIAEVEKTAKILADRAKSLHYDVEMQPMTPYERMIVHSILESDPEVVTESIGKGSQRRVVIRYVGGAENV